MKLSNFELTGTHGTRLMTRTYSAEVDVTTGFWWFKKVLRHKISRKYIGSWFFVKDGRYTPGLQAEMLERSWRAMNNKPDN